MVEFLITMLVVCVVVYVVYLVLGMLSLPAPIKTIIYLIIGLIVVLWLLNYFGIYESSIGDIHTHRIN